MKTKIKEFFTKLNVLICKIVKKLVEIFQDSTGAMSSKRVFGGIGFIASLIMCFKDVSVDAIGIVIGTSAAMLGLDSVTDIWKKHENKINE